MKLRYLVSTFALALTTVAAHAQIGLYLNPIVTRASNSKADTGPFAFLGDNDTSQTFGGVSIGGYYTFLQNPALNVSFDVRDQIEHGNNALLNSFLVGPRVASHPLAFGLKPYAQISIGSGTTHSPYNGAHTTKLAFDGFVGADKTLGKHVDWRIIEVGYGSVTTTSSQVHQSGTSIPAAKLLNFSAGLVFRIK
ncbi:hypothetical protein GOB94_11115 [Granulicella sp. 5B5]|uniref:hypothetical protein n=1 Tax=Granulicella sp. 5B5 TaxID=1617967 RepID=UPI0015F3E651|nr:hypothetical protein [Granulicella sp. 5B5]QMV19165.1 hypothetical protein GOB94_11115 [Granulicella sp. 5B5]